MSFKENRFVYRSTPDNNPSANLAQLFEDTQLSALDSLYDLDSKGINLADAEERGLITAEVRKRIEDIPDAEGLFKSILAVESEEANTEAERRSAFKTAFRKFINKEAFGAETGLDANDPVNDVLLPKLNEVLRSDLSIGDSGLKGRSELQSAAGRLRMLLADEKAEAELSTTKTALPAYKARKGQLQKEIKALEFPGFDKPKAQHAELVSKGVLSGVVIADVFSSLRNLLNAVSFLSPDASYGRCDKIVKSIEASAAVIPDRVGDLILEMEVLQKAASPLKSTKEGELEATEKKITQAERWSSKARKSSSLLAKVKEQTAREIPAVERGLKDEKAKMAIDEKKVDELEAKLRDLREKDKEYVAWLAKVKEQTAREIPAVEAGLKDEKARTAEGQKKVDELQARLNDLREKNRDHVACLARVEKQAENEIAVVKTKLDTERAKIPVDKKKVDALRAKLSDLRKEDKDYGPWLAKVKEKTAEEISGVEAKLRDENAKTPVDKKKVDELQAKLNDLREKDKDYVAWLVKVGKQTEKEISVVKAELNVESAKTAKGRGKVDGLEVRLNDLQEKDKDYVAWLAKVKEQTEKEIPVREDELKDEKAKVPVDKKKVGELQARLNDLRKKNNAYIACLARVEEQTAKEIPVVEAELNVEKAKTAVDKRRVDELEEKLAGLRQKETDYVGWILDKGFKSKKTDAEIETLEREHEEAVRNQTELKSTYDFFADGKELSATVKAYDELKALRKPADDPEFPNEGFHARKFRVKAEYDAMTAQRTNNNQNKGGRSGQVDAIIREEKDKIDAKLNGRVIEQAKKTPYTPEEVAKVRQEIVAGRRAEIETEIAVSENTASTKIALARAKQTGPKLRDYELLQQAETQAKAFHSKLEALLGMLEKAEKAGVTMAGVGTNSLDIKQLKIDLGDVNLNSDNFSPWEFANKFNGLVTFVRNDLNMRVIMKAFDAKKAEKNKAVSEAKKALDDAKTDSGRNKDLTDSAASMRILETIIAEQVASGALPDMSLEKQKGLAAMILAGDVATIQSLEDYEALAKRGSAELLDTLHEALFKQKVVFMRVKDGEKVLQPFKNMKLKDFKDPKALKSAFKTGALKCNVEKAQSGDSLNDVNAFLVLAAFQIMNEGNDKPAEQELVLERKIKENLARTLGLSTRLNEAGASRIVDDLFNEQLALVRPRVQEMFGGYDANSEARSAAKVKELEIQYQILVEENRLRKVKHRYNPELLEKDDQILKNAKQKLLDTADEFGIQDRLSFGQESALKDFWDNSAISHWFGDLGHNILDVTTGKAKAVALGTVGMAARLPLEAGKVGLGYTLGAGRVITRGAYEVLATPVRLLVKNPVKAAVRIFVPGASPISQFGADTLSDVKAVVGNVGGSAKTASEKISARKGQSVTNIKGTWSKAGEARRGVKFENKKHGDRTKVDIGALKETAKGFADDAEEKNPAISGSEAVVDLAKYRERVAQLDKFSKPPEAKAA